jgi:hypothetical protein
MIKRLLARPRRLDEHAQILLGLGLPHKLMEVLRAHVGVTLVFWPILAVDKALVHDSASSFSACRINFSVG